VGNGETITFTCNKRNDLINDYIRIVDFYLFYFKREAQSPISFRSFASKLRVLDDQSEHYFNVKVILFRSFLCIIKENLSPEAESEGSSLFLAEICSRALRMPTT
jgi:hypothetical protein